jgi:hypothetical protein
MTVTQSQFLRGGEWIKKIGSSDANVREMLNVCHYASVLS